MSGAGDLTSGAEYSHQDTDQDTCVNITTLILDIEKHCCMSVSKDLTMSEAMIVSQMTFLCFSLLSALTEGKRSCNKLSLIRECRHYCCSVLHLLWRLYCPLCFNCHLMCLLHHQLPCTQSQPELCLDCLPSHAASTGYCVISL